MLSVNCPWEISLFLVGRNGVTSSKKILRIKRHPIKEMQLHHGLLIMTYHDFMSVLWQFSLFFHARSHHEICHESSCPAGKFKEPYEAMDLSTLDDFCSLRSDLSAKTRPNLPGDPKKNIFSDFGVS